MAEDENKIKAERPRHQHHSESEYLDVYQLGDGDSVMELSMSGQTMLTDNGQNTESPKIYTNHFNHFNKSGRVKTSRIILGSD